jgi:hypothetical protein
MNPTLSPRRSPAAFGFALAALAGTLAILFHRSFDQSMVLFSNDGPLGPLNAKALAVPGAFSGYWIDLNWIGIFGGSASPTITYAILWAFGPVGFAKFYEPLSLLVLGLSAFYFFRSIGLRPSLATLGGLAAMLNMNFFSNVCWGLGTRAICLGMVFLALGLILNCDRDWRWPRLALAGLFVGMAVLEGADNGAIFSIFVAGFVVVHAWSKRTSIPKAVVEGVGGVGVVAICAGFMAAQAFAYLIPSQITNVSAGKADPANAVQSWDFATQWSLPKIELSRVLVPGIFGYRMYTMDGSDYWGAVGQSAGWEPSSRGGTPRYSGSGEYAGVFVLAVALWAVARSLSRKKNSYADSERWAIRFWAVCAVIGVVFAFGRHAPFFRLFYSLPYCSSIRNPIKFMHVFHLCAMVLFGYGLLDLNRCFLQGARPSNPSLGASLKAAMGRIGSFERAWILASISALCAAVLAFMIFASSKSDLVKHLVQNGFSEGEASPIAQFSAREVLLFVVFLAASLGLIAAIVAGAFAGARSKWAALLLGVVLVTDLGRADQYWVQYYDYKERYATNDLFDQLRDHPYEHRVAARMVPNIPGNFIVSKDVMQWWPGVHEQWLEHSFQFYDIQSLDIPQMPRPPALESQYIGSFIPRANAGYLPGRLWQLTNTRYILGMAGFKDALNQEFDPKGHRFQIRALFTIGQEHAGGPLVVKTNLNATSLEHQFALFEFTGALPRAKLYTRWQTSNNDGEVLAQLVNPDFDPAQSAFVSAEATAPASASGPDDPQASVEFASYAPKKIVLKAKAGAKSLLLLNDRHDPNWIVRVDGARKPLLRANFIMRGVVLDPGQHEVVFTYEPPMTGLHISLGAILLGVALCGFLTVAPGRKELSAPTAADPNTPPRGKNSSTAQDQAAKKSAA